MKSFDAALVTLRDNAFAPRQQLVRQYLLGFDLDRLMHNFRVHAGLPSAAVPLGGWEAPDCLLRGHFVGHFLSACAKAAHALRDEALAEKARQIVAVMQDCIREDGYLSAFPESQLDDLERNESYGIWAPYYTLHKILAGLCDCGKLLNCQAAVELAHRLAKYIHRRMSALSMWKIDGMLRCTKTNPTNEFGGVGDALYSLWELTGDEQVKALAGIFDRDYWLAPLWGGRDVLADLHANTHLPMVIAAAHRYEVTGEEHYRRAVENFYGFLKERTFGNGNSSSRAERFYPGTVAERSEHWGGPRLDRSYLTGGESECCCGYNTEKLLAYLIGWQPDVERLDHLEGLKYNALLNALSARSGLSQYHQPMGAGQRKKFSSYDQDFWCCTGTGLETAIDLPNHIWLRAGDAALVNIFVSSDLEWPEKGATLCLRSDYPRSCRAAVEVHCEEAAEMTLMFKAHRVQSITAPGADVTQEGGFLLVRGTWKDGDVIDVEIASEVTWEPISEAEPEVTCAKYGPILLAKVKKEAVPADCPVISPAQEGDVFIPWYLVEDEEYAVYNVAAQDRGAAPEGKQM